MLLFKYEVLETLPCAKWVYYNYRSWSSKVHQWITSSEMGVIRTGVHLFVKALIKKHKQSGWCSQ